MPVDRCFKMFQTTPRFSLERARDDLSQLESGSCCQSLSLSPSQARERSSGRRKYLEISRNLFYFLHEVWFRGLLYPSSFYRAQQHAQLAVPRALTPASTPSSSPPPPSPPGKGYTSPDPPGSCAASQSPRRVVWACRGLGSTCRPSSAHSPCGPSSPRLPRLRDAPR